MAEVSGDNLELNNRPAANSANGWQGERAYFCELRGDQESTTTTLIPNCQPSSKGPGPPTIYVRTVKSEAIGWYALEYWFLYFDDYWSRQDPVEVVRPAYQTHEGDWEEITILLDGRRRPRVIIYSQHGAGEVRPWATATASFGVEYAAGHPFAYVARGSHAEYFSAGHTRSIHS